jgi:hypothetical protein
LPWRCSLRRRAAVRHDGVRVARATGDALTRIGRHDAQALATAVPGLVPPITSFTSLDAVRGFAGDDYEQAVVEEPPGRHSTGATNGSHTIR